MTRLRFACRVLAFVAALGAVATIVGMVFQTLHILGVTPQIAGGMLEVRFDLADPAPGTPLYLSLPAALLELLPELCLLWVFVSLYRLMRLYGEGEVFTGPGIGQIHAIARGLLARALGIIILNPVAGMLLSLARPQHFLSIGLGNADSARLFEAAVVYVIALVMEEARRVADENARFI